MICFILLNGPSTELLAMNGKISVQLDVCYGINGHLKFQARPGRDRPMPAARAQSIRLKIKAV